MRLPAQVGGDAAARLRIRAHRLPAAPKLHAFRFALADYLEVERKEEIPRYREQPARVYQLRLDHVEELAQRTDRSARGAAKPKHAWLWQR
jgi:hypothetical protein